MTPNDRKLNVKEKYEILRKDRKKLENLWQRNVTLSNLVDLIYKGTDIKDGAVKEGRIASLTTDPSNPRYVPNLPKVNSGVNYLANFLTTTLFPANSTFFDAKLDEEGRQLYIDDLREKENSPYKHLDATAGEFESLIQQFEETAKKLAMNTHNKRSIQNVLTNLFRYLIVYGNCLLYYPLKGDRTNPSRIISPFSYCIKRNPKGKLTLIIYKSFRNLEEFPKDKQAEIKERCENNSVEGYGNYLEQSEHLSKDNVPVYHEIEWNYNTNKYTYTEYAIDDIKVSETSYYTTDSLPYKALVWARGEGDHYGTSLLTLHEIIIKEYSDLYVSTVSQIGFLTANIRLVPQQLGLSPDALGGRQTRGQVLSITGNVRDNPIGSLYDGQDAQTLNTLISVKSEKEKQVGRIFLEPDSNIRDTRTRISATEIQYLNNALKVVHSDAFTALAEDLQIPLAKMLLEEIADLPELEVDGKYQFRASTGRDSVIKQQKFTGTLEVLSSFAQIIQQFPELTTYVNPDVLLTQGVEAVGNETTVLYSKEERDARRQQQQQEQVAMEQQMQQAQQGIPGPQG